MWVVRLPLEPERRPRSDTAEHILPALERHSRQLGVKRRCVGDAGVFFTRQDLIGMCEEIFYELGSGAVGRPLSDANVPNHELNACTAPPLIDRDLARKIDCALTIDQLVDVCAPESDRWY